MRFKEALAHNFRCFLSIISPKLNTKVCYYFKFGKKLNLDRPETLNEKILWLKFNSYLNNDVIKQCADKYQVREYLKRKGYETLLNPLIGAYDNIESIPWDDLPNSFALKLNVGCGKNIIVHNKHEIDASSVKLAMKSWLSDNYWKAYSEMQYKDVKPYILIEEYLGGPNGELPDDYKFYCMNGKSKYVMVCEDREIGEKAKYFYFDRDWNMMPYTQDALDDPKRVIPKPEHIDEAFEIAEKLSKEFTFVRVDLYIINGKVFFGEFTFTPSAGLDNGRLPQTDRMLGEQLSLE